MAEQSFGRFLAIVRGRWRLVTALGLPVVLLSLWFAASRPPAYSSEVVVGFHPEPALFADNSFLRLMPRYLLTATSEPALRAAESQAGLPAGALGDSVTVENPSGTVEVSLTVTTESAEAAQLAVGALSDAVLTAAAADPLVTADVLAGPTDAVDRAPTRQALLVAVGFAVAAVLGVSVAFVVEGARPRLRVREDVAALGIPVLAAVAGRHLSGRARVLPRPTQPREAPAGLRFQVDAAAGAGLMVTSPSSADAAVVEALVGLLPGSGAPPSAIPGVLAHPGLLDDDSARDAATDARQCLLVLRAGTPVDQAQDSLRLLERLDVRVVGGVLVT
jgi:molybdopterin-binding protein